MSAFGTWGALAEGTGRAGDLTDEIASVYARIAAVMGYVRPRCHLARRQWEEMAAGVEAWARAAPRSVDDVLREFGAPSYRNLATDPRVLPYGAEGDRQWLSFDFPEGRELLGIRIDSVEHGGRCIDLRLRSEGGSPEQAYREFLIASLSGRREQIEPLLLTGEEPARLWAGPYPDDVGRALASHYETMAIARTETPESEVFLISEGFPIPLRLVRTSQGMASRSRRSPPRATRQRVERVVVTTVSKPR